MKIRNIIGYEGLYAISDDGVVFNLEKGTILKAHDAKGYEHVTLSGKSHSIHRLVYEAFHGKLIDGLVIDHIDGNTKNNNVNNLRQISNRENVAIGHNRKKKNDTLPTGVTFYEHIKKYGAYINIQKRRYHLGVFSSIEDASMAYQFALHNWVENKILPKQKDKSTKYCKSCKKTLPRESFYVNKRGWYSCMCKECTKALKKEQYHNSKETI